MPLTIAHTKRGTPRMVTNMAVLTNGGPDIVTNTMANVMRH